MKKKVSLILNLLIIILEIIGFIFVYKYHGGISFEYYTEDSNILALLASIIYVMYLLSNKKIPRWLSLIKYTSVISLTVTFLVVLFILIPMSNFDFKFYLFKDALLFQHLLCPILFIVTFILFDDLKKYTIKDNIYGLSFTIVYSVVLIILNILGMVSGPYPFLMVKEQTLLINIMWTITLLSMAYFIAYLLRKLYNKFNLN